jgi:hypothetical protein
MADYLLVLEKEECCTFSNDSGKTFDNIHIIYIELKKIAGQFSMNSKHLHKNFGINNIISTLLVE